MKKMVKAKKDQVGGAKSTVDQKTKNSRDQEFNELMENVFDLEDQCVYIRRNADALANKKKTGMVIVVFDKEDRCLTIFNALNLTTVPLEHDGTKVTTQQLYEALAEHPDGMHIIEKADALLDDPTSSEWLRTVLSPPTSKVVRNGRVVWKPESDRKDETDSILFAGAVVLCTTKEVTEIPWFKEVRSKVVEARLDVTGEAMDGVVELVKTCDADEVNIDAVWEVFDRLLLDNGIFCSCAYVAERREYLGILSRFFSDVNQRKTESC